jgi:uncharacterized membrane protein YeaQ/YmgE (transglycosylase-associated protein family)
LVVAVIGSAALPESTVGAVVGEVMLTAIGLTVRPRVAVQVVVSEVGAV